MSEKLEFKLIQSGLETVDAGGDGFIEGSEPNQVVLYSGTANLTSAGRIAVGLLFDGVLRVDGSTKVFTSHPFVQVSTVEMLACQWVFENRPSDDSVEMLNWLESLGLRDFEARRVHSLFIRFCVWSMFKGIEINFKPSLSVVD